GLGLWAFLPRFYRIGLPVYIVSCLKNLDREVVPECLALSLPKLRTAFACKVLCGKPVVPFSSKRSGLHGRQRPPFAVLLRSDVTNTSVDFIQPISVLRPRFDRSHWLKYEPRFPPDAVQLRVSVPHVFGNALARKPAA